MKKILLSAILAMSSTIFAEHSFGTGDPQGGAAGSIKSMHQQILSCTSQAIKKRDKCISELKNKGDGTLEDELYQSILSNCMVTYGTEFPKCCQDAYNDRMKSLGKAPITTDINDVMCGFMVDRAKMELGEQ